MKLDLPLRDALTIYALCYATMDNAPQNLWHNRAASAKNRGTGLASRKSRRSKPLASFMR